MTKQLQTLAAFVFLIAVYTTPTAALPEVAACQTETYSCFGVQASFSNCEESCGFNWDWCANYCGGSPTDFGCGGVPPSTTGFCHCAPCIE